MRKYFFVAILLCFCLCGTAEARGRRGGGGGSGGWQSFPEGAKIIVHDGLPLVNALRAARGLHPFKRNDALFAGAAHQADNQARHGFMGHGGCRMDGANAEGVGCADVGTPGGWNSCCWTEGYREAACAYVDVTYPGGSTNRFCAIHVR